LTQSTDEFFFTASNQIVKDLRSPHPELRKTGATAGLELVPATSAHSDARSRETCKLEKEPNRKAVFRPLRWPEASFVTVPYRGSKSFIPQSRSGDKHSKRAIPKDPQLATRSEYQSFPARCKWFFEKRISDDAEAGQSLLLLLTGVQIDGRTIALCSGWLGCFR
jgi:hypothetical protein